jgi:hypothetical protein
VIARTDAGATLLREAGPQPSYFGQCAPGVELSAPTGAFTELIVRSPGRAEERLRFAKPMARGRIVLPRDIERGMLARDEKH